MHFQLAEVDRSLISVARLVDAGNRVVFGPTGGFIFHVATGRKVQLVRGGNASTLGMHLFTRAGGGWGHAEGCPEEQPAPAPGFARQDHRG